MPDLDNTVSTKVADSTLNRIEDYAEEHGMSRSEAIRNRLRAGFEAADDDTLRGRLILAATTSFLGGVPTAAAATRHTYAAIFFIVIVAILIILQPQIDRILDRLPF